MPIYEYKCTKCKKIKDKLVTRVEMEAGKEFSCEDELATECDGVLEKNDAPTAAVLRFRGNWSGTTGTF